MNSARVMPAVAWSPRSGLYVHITCAKVRKDSHSGICARVACLALQHEHEAQCRGAPAVCIAVHGLQVDCIAAEWEAIMASSASIHL
jgi:hypothetical protein